MKKMFLMMLVWMLPSMALSHTQFRNAQIYHVEVMHNGFKIFIENTSTSGGSGVKVISFMVGARSSSFESGTSWSQTHTNESIQRLLSVALMAVTSKRKISVLADGAYNNHYCSLYNNGKFTYPGSCASENMNDHDYGFILSLSQ